MFAVETSFNDDLDILFDLTTTEEELIAMAYEHKQAMIGSSIRATVFNLVKALSAGQSTVGITVDFVVGACFEFEINLSRKQIADALAGLRRSGKLWRYQAEPGYFLPSANLADYDRSIH